MAKWEDLSMHEKHAFIRTAVKNGIRDIGSIREAYNRYDDGGDIIDDNPSDSVRKGIDYINSYYQSDGFNARRDAYSKYKEDPYELKRNKDRLDHVEEQIREMSTAKSRYDPRSNTLTVGTIPAMQNEDDLKLNIPVLDTAAHEATHMWDFPMTNSHGTNYDSDIDRGERGFLSDLPKKLREKHFEDLPENVNQHDALPEEQYADLGALRASLFDVVGYDSRAVDANGNPIPISDELWNKFMQTDAYKNNRYIKIHGDARARQALQDIAYNTYRSERNFAANGGGLDFLGKPFSYRPIPAVRYDFGGKKIHKVAAGEVLESIARKYGVTVADIVAANKGLSADKINLGQELIIPASNSSTQSQSNSTSSGQKKTKSSKRKVDFAAFQSAKGTSARATDFATLEQLQDSLIKRGYPEAQRAAILASSYNEMDKRGAASRGIGGNGILGLSKERMPVSLLGNTSDKRGEQIHYIMEDLGHVYTGTHPMAGNWNDGGKGGPSIMSGQDGFTQFNAETDAEKAAQILNKSYVRPALQSDWYLRGRDAKLMTRFMK